MLAFVVFVLVFQY